MQDLVTLTRQMGAEGQIRHIHHFPARAGVRAAWPGSVHSQVQAAYHAIGIDEPWQHQAQALDHIAEGATTVVATGTGSGKSLPAWAQALSATCAYQEDRHGERAGSLSFRLRRPTALFLCPTKALAVDQLASAHGLVAAGNLPVQVARADGDCSTAERSFAQKHADIVVTNPDFVHYSLLARHQRWARLLGALSLIVIDEAHAYRGLTGAHVALVVRRLLRVAHRLGARPTVVFLTATVSDPYQLANAMLGDCAGHIATVTEDTSAAGERHLLWWKPSDFENNDAAYLSAAYACAGARTLTFVRARASAEAVAGQIQYLLRKESGEQTAGLKGSLRYAAYRGGYLPQERRELEAGLKSGALAGLVATNALELGIDIAGLDAVVISGWPGSRASIMQQAGRAGRAGRPGIAVFVARDDPLDIYLTDHADQVLSAGAEGTVFDLSNLHILTPHVCAAASEFPLTAADVRYFPWGQARGECTHRAAEVGSEGADEAACERARGRPGPSAQVAL
ncbi:MAG: DEAD/DEAH box helicase [Bowdeniella nasicola]|nr:DEAD/DEAH box helicase [Bowdeniella nasicola]